MSSSALHWAFSQRLATSQQQVLLYVIAESADPHGMARQCNADHLAECSRLSRGGLLKCLSALRSVGVIETAEKFTEDGARVFDLRLLMEKSVNLHRSDKPNGELKPVESGHDMGSPEGRAIILMHEMVGLSEYLRKVMIRNGVVNYLQPVAPRLLALAQSGPQDAWPILTRQQAAAWEGLLREFVTVQVRRRLKEGDRAPWPWPPSAEGKLYTATGPPDAELSDQDAADLK